MVAATFLVESPRKISPTEYKTYRTQALKILNITEDQGLEAIKNECEISRVIDSLADASKKH
jgi:hypothetical protein